MGGGKSHAPETEVVFEIGPFFCGGVTAPTEAAEREVGLRPCIHSDGGAVEASAYGWCDDGLVAGTFEPALVPELLVVNVDRSLVFWGDVCGFEIRYSRSDECFAYIALGSAHLMLEQIGIGRNWITGPLEEPLGRGINFQISVPDTVPLVAALARANIDLFVQPETKWYRVGNEEAGVDQFLVTDPDGYLIRFQSSRGYRPATP